MICSKRWRTRLSARLEPAPTLRGDGPLAALSVAQRRKADVGMLIVGLEPRRAAQIFDPSALID